MNHGIHGFHGYTRIQKTKKSVLIRVIHTIRDKKIPQAIPGLFYSCFIRVIHGHPFAAVKKKSRQRRD